MTDSMKFGPEWLRTLSETGPQTARYQLAEYRYGREEMLALFSHSLSPPESLRSIPGLFIEKCQAPIALSPISEDEARMWNRGVNPDMGGAGSGGRGGGKGTGEGRGRREGRGGRGRGGLTGGTFYGRSPNPFDPDGNGLDSGGGQLFSRIRAPFQTERTSWSERNGESPSGRGRGTDSNWRRGSSHRSDDEGPGGGEWRSGKWLGSTGSSSRSNWREEEWWPQQLPEWALDKGDSVQGGSFDASGAFHDHADDELPVRDPLLSKAKKTESKEKDCGGGGSEKEDERPPESAPPAQSQQTPSAGGLEEIKKQLAALEKDEEVPPSEIEEIRKQLERLESKRRQRVDDEKVPQPTPQPQQQQVQQPVHPVQPPPVQHQTQHIQQVVPQQTQQQVQQTIQPQHPQPAPATESLPPVSAPPPSLHQSGASHLSALSRLHQEPPPPMQEEADMNIATDLVSKLMDDAEKQDKQWYYRDPQGEVQGPFTASEMAEWFNSGYFTLSLMVRRGCDPTMMPLGELIKIWGCIPFLVDGGDGDHAFKTEAHYRQMAARQRAALGKLPNQWPPEHNQQVVPNQMVEGYPVPAAAAAQQQASNQLRALLAQMQQKQRDAMASTGPTSPVMPPPPQQPPPPAKEVIHTPGGSSSGVMETLMSLHREQVAQQAALQAALHQHQMEHHQAAGASLHSLLRQMQHKQQMASHIPPQQQQQQPPPSVDSVWNGVGNNQWSQWAQPTSQQPKGIKTEQQVIEEQMRAEDDRKREEHLRKADDGNGKEEELRLEDRPRPDHADCPRHDDDAIRRKHEAARRAEVERQRKEEEKRKREEEKRRKEEEKRKLDERERLKHGEERKKKEAEEKATADLMSRIQRAQWCPPAASNTSLLEIQRAQAAAREQALARAAAAEAAVQAQEKSTGMHLGWTETRQTTAESLVEIQQQQYRQFVIKQMQEKEKAEREKKEVGPSWAHGGLTWGARTASTSVWGNASGFWDAKPQQPQQAPPPSQPQQQQQAPQLQKQPPPPPHQPQPPQQQQKKEQKQPTSKAKRDELAVLHMFNPAVSQGQDDFTSWCQAALKSFTMQFPVDIPTFVTFLRDVEKAEEVVDYVRNYVGETKESLEFARQFLERRRATGGGGGGGIPPALHHEHEDFQQVKGKGKSKKKGKGVQKVDPRILGFSTNAAPVGDRDYADDV